MRARERRVEYGERGPAGAAYAAAAEVDARRLADGAARRNEERKERSEERREGRREKPAPGSWFERELLRRHDPGF